VWLTAYSGVPGSAQPSPSSALLPALAGEHSWVEPWPWAIAPTVAPAEILIQSTRRGGIELCVYPEGLGACSMTTIIGRDGRIRMLCGSGVTADTRITSAELATFIAALDQADGTALQAGMVPHQCEHDLIIAVTLFTTAGRVDLAGCDADLDRTRPPFSTIEPLLDTSIWQK
jgi:hypothetical protein